MMFTTEVNALDNLLDFIRKPTPNAWLSHAIENLPTLLIDHAHCERKAAMTALHFISKYPRYTELVDVMSPLAREELLHFEKVMNFIKAKDIKFIGLKPARYSQTLHQQLSAEEGKHRLRDSLIIGAIIEARSCERFNALIPYLEDGALKRFYVTLVKSEARHFQDYLALAKHYAGDITKRLDELLTLENQLIVTEEAVFRFHSGIPLYISTD